MASLVNVVARRMDVWPSGFDSLSMCFDGEVMVHGEPVTRAQWQAERDRMEEIKKSTVEVQFSVRDRAQHLLETLGERDQEIKELVELACGKKLPHAFTEADIRAAFEAGANWANGGVKAGALEYVEKLKGLK